MWQKHLKKLGNYFLYFFFGLGGGAVGFFLFAIPFKFLQLNIGQTVSFQIDPTNLLSLIITTGLALYVVRVLNRKDDGDKVERDLLIGYFDKFESNFSEEVHKITTSNGIEGSDVAATFKKYGMSAQELVELAKSHPSGNTENLDSLESCMSVIRELLTDTPAEGEIEDGVRIEGTRIFYSTRHIGKVTTAMGRFKKAVFSVIVGINRS